MYKKKLFVYLYENPKSYHNKHVGTRAFPLETAFKTPKNKTSVGILILTTSQQNSSRTGYLITYKVTKTPNYNDSSNTIILTQGSIRNAYLQTACNTNIQYL